MNHGRARTKKIASVSDAYLASARLRFLDKVHAEPNTGCWLWLAATNGDAGYGLFYFRGRLVAAHRVSYELFVGTLPDDLVVDHHKCDTPGCVNPDHLKAVTQKVNTLRGRGPSAEAARRTICPNGHPLSGENLRIQKTVKGLRRDCRLCYAATARATRERKKAKKEAQP